MPVPSVPGFLDAAGPSYRPTALYAERYLHHDDGAGSAEAHGDGDDDGFHHLLPVDAHDDDHGDCDRARDHVLAELDSQAIARIPGGYAALGLVVRSSTESTVFLLPVCAARARALASASKPPKDQHKPWSVRKTEQIALFAPVAAADGDDDTRGAAACVRCFLRLHHHRSYPKRPNGIGLH